MIYTKIELTRYFKELETKQLGKIFRKYMESLGVKKWDSRRKDNRNTYLIDGKSTDWNRVQCYSYKDSERFAEENISFVLRKRSGNYFIIARKGKRAFEIDHRGIIAFDGDLLKEIIKDHERLFEMLSESIRK